MQSGIFHILVGIDFSDSSARAMYHALVLAERLGAVMHLGHISVPTTNVAANTDLGLNVPSEFEDEQQARERLERMRAMLCTSVQVELHLRTGDPVQGLLDLAEELRPDMLIVGSHGRGAVMRLLLGSVSTQLTRLCPVPVLVVPAVGRQAAAQAEPAAATAAPTPSETNMQTSGGT